MMSIDAGSILENLLQELASSNVTLGSKQKSLSMFCNQANSTGADFSLIISKIPGKDYYSRNLRLYLAIKLKNFEYILELLKTEDKFLLKKLTSSKTDWLFSETSPLVNIDYIFNEILPIMSFNLKNSFLQCLFKYLKNTKKQEELYTIIKNNYGALYAFNFLLKSSEDFISSVLAQKNPPIPDNILKTLYLKVPEAVYKYLSDSFDSIPLQTWFGRSQGNTTSNYIYTVKAIAKHEPIKFMDFYEKYSELLGTLKLGNRASHFLTRNYIDRILSFPKIYSRVLSINTLKNLKRFEIIPLMASNFPQDISKFKDYHEIHNWLNVINKIPKKISIIKKAFYLAYKKRFTDHLDGVSTKLLELLKLKDRVIVSENKLKDSSNNWALWTAFKDTKDSIPAIKQVLKNESDQKKRQELIQNLIYTCFLNKDTKSLADILSLIATRYRNEQAEFHVTLLSYTTENFDLLKLPPEPWEPINQILKIISLVPTHNSHYKYTEILQKSFIYRAKNNLPLKSSVKDFLKANIYTPNITEIINNQLQKKFLELGIEVMEEENFMQDSKKSEKNSRFYLIRFFAVSVYDWNRKHRSDPLVPTKWLQDALQETFEVEYDDPNSFKKSFMALAAFRGQTIETSLQLFGEFLIQKHLVEFIGLFFTKIPEFFLKNIHLIIFSILNENLKPYQNIIKKIKNEGYLELTEKIIQICTDKLEQGMPKEIQNSILLLSLLLNTDSYLSLIEKYCPVSDKIDLEHPDVQKDVAIKIAVVSSLKNLEFPSETFAVLSRFCAGDYLKHSVGPLYSVSSYSPMVKLNEFLIRMISKPVSVKKHAIRLACKNMSEVKAFSFLAELWKTEKNVSVREIILNEWFSKLTSQWPDQLTEAIESLEVAETNSIDNLATSYPLKVPSSYIESYFTLVWNLYDRLNIDDTKKLSLINALATNRVYFSDSFIESLVQRYLFSKGVKKDLRKAVSVLAAREFLISAPGSSFASMIFSYIETQAKSNNDISIWEPMNYFISDVSKFFCSNTSYHSYLSQNKFVAINNLLTHIEGTSNIYEVIYIKLILINTNYSNSWKTIGEKTGELLDLYLAQNYGKEFIGFMTKVLNDVHASYTWEHPFYYRSESNMIDFIEGVVYSESTNYLVERQLFAIDWLPPVSTRTNNWGDATIISEALKPTYIELLNNLKKIPNAVLQTRLYIWELANLR